MCRGCVAGTGRNLDGKNATRNCRETIGTVDLASLRDRLFRVSRIGRTYSLFYFFNFLRKNVFNEICKETIGEVDFALLRDRRILAPRRTVPGGLLFSEVFVFNRFQ